MSTIRSTGHDYPREEINAMLEFYGSKKCIISKSTNSVQWAHIMDAALGTSDAHVISFLIFSSIAMLTS